MMKHSLPLALFWCLYCQLSTYFTPCSSVSIVNFGHVIAGLFLVRSEYIKAVSIIWNIPFFTLLRKTFNLECLMGDFSYSAAQTKSLLKSVKP